MAGYEWFNPAREQTTKGGMIRAAGSSQDSRAFFRGTPSFTSIKQRSKTDSHFMKAPKPSMDFRALWLLSTVALLASSGGPAAAVEPPETSVKNLKLKVSANGRYFVDQEGKPFFYLGDTCWLLFQRLNREELDEYLKDRAAKGFTVIQAYVLRGLGKQHPDGNSSLLDATPFIDRDPTRPNEEFFKNVDYVVNRANELGLVMGLVTAKSWHVTDHPEKVFDEKNAYTFGKFLGERYKNNAVMWFPGGDSAPGKYDAVWVAMAKGLKDGCGGSQLVCYHGQGSTSSSMWFHKADWLDFNSIQSGHNFGSDSYAFVSKDYALTPAKPTVDMEPAYENHPTGANKPRIDSHKVRTQAYPAMLAGAAGHGYGSLDLFYFYKDADGPFPKNGFQTLAHGDGLRGLSPGGLHAPAVRAAAVVQNGSRPVGPRLGARQRSVSTRRRAGRRRKLRDRLHAGRSAPEHCA